MQPFSYRRILPRQSCPSGLHGGKIAYVCLIHAIADELRYQKYYGFDFMQDLIGEMTHVDPAKRPSIEEVVAEFSRIRESLSGFKLRSTIIAKDDPVLNSMFRRARQALRTVRYICSHKAAIPDAS